MYFINACATISHQNSFNNPAWLSELSPLSSESELMIPNYKEYIPGGSLRRMGKIIRMGIACSKVVLADSKIENPDAIIVGTGLGCLLDTEKFLNNALTIEGLIPPTSFIQSTHNTIAGQISLATKNHNYNITHTQNTLSFEHALIDAMLYLAEDKNNILVGSADESIPILKELAQQFGLANITDKITTGASFFMLANQQQENSKAVLLDSQTFGLNTEKPELLIEKFLSENKLDHSQIDLVLWNSNSTKAANEIEKELPNIPLLATENYCGYYFSNAAFSLHLAADIIATAAFTLDDKTLVKPKTILIYNNFNNSNIGLTLVTAI